METHGFLNVVHTRWRDRVVRRIVIKGAENTVKRFFTSSTRKEASERKRGALKCHASGWSQMVENVMRDSTYSNHDRAPICLHSWM